MFASALCFLAASFYYITDPVVDMRETASDNSKIVSQAIFSDNIEINQPSEGWSLITTPDGYTGWIHNTSFVKRDSAYNPNLTTSSLTSHLYDIQDTEYGPSLTLPYGSQLQGSAVAGNDRWLHVELPNGDKCYIQKGNVAPQQPLQSKSDLVSFSHRFLGLPYTWGGRSSFGYDCSGFVQMLYRHIGIDLERDSKQQILDNRFKTVPLENLEHGDLIFFGKAESKISHVGLYIGNGQFIHATVRENQPWIRISKLSDFEWNGNPAASSPHRLGRQFVQPTKRE